jgi:hypothetical protein
MGIFSTIMDKIFHHSKAAQPATPTENAGGGAANADGNVRAAGGRASTGLA